jgi:hypothetical protein
MRFLISVAVIGIMCFAVLHQCDAQISGDSTNGLTGGIPLGGGDSDDIPGAELCPQGIHVVESFLASWQHNDYETMYSYLDDDSKSKYTVEQARMDFRLLEYNNYKISSIRQNGDNFEFVLSAGDWKQGGSKDVQKIVINGKTFKVIMQTKHSPFKRSIADYF